jgi:predicted alpha/beta hydrolase
VPPARLAALLHAGHATGGYAPRRAVEWIPALYPDADSTVHMLDEEYRRLGHFGGFQQAAAPLWTKAWAWLDRTTTRRG